MHGNLLATGREEGLPRAGER